MVDATAGSDAQQGTSGAAAGAHGVSSFEHVSDIGQSEAWMVNMKRLFDEFLDLSINTARRSNAHVDLQLADVRQNDNTRQNIATQALQNAVETANMVGKQSVRHGDIAIDRQWNIDEVANAAVLAIEKMRAATED